jgi:hypothetical protein
MCNFLKTIYVFVATISVLLFLISCAMVDITLGARYQKMPQQLTGGERVIDQVILEGQVKESSNGTPSSVRIGTPYRVLESRGSERHHDEYTLDRLLNVAQKKFPNEAIDIRNATKNYRYLGSRTQNMPSGDKVISVTTTTYQEYYTANVVTSDPMPNPVTYSVNIPLIGLTRGDLYRRADNWLDDRKYNDNKAVAGVRIQRADFDVGRIKGEYVFYTDQGYIIISNFTIDVHDEKAEVSFENTRLQRKVSGTEEPIFLQSIANSAEIELKGFSENLKTHMSSARR